MIFLTRGHVGQLKFVNGACLSSNYKNCYLIWKPMMSLEHSFSSNFRKIDNARQMRLFSEPNYLPISENVPRLFHKTITAHKWYARLLNTKFHSIRFVKKFFILIAASSKAVACLDTNLSTILIPAATVQFRYICIITGISYNLKCLPLLTRVIQLSLKIGVWSVCLPYIRWPCASN